MYPLLQAITSNLLGDVLLPSQIRTFVALLLGLMCGHEAGIAGLGRGLAPMQADGLGPGEKGAKVKSCINRTYRFVTNPRIDVGRVCQAMIRALALTRRTVVVATDWTEISSLSVLVSAIVISGRAVPIFWTVIDGQRIRKVSVEVEHLRTVSRMMAGYRVVHVLDRGFDGAKFLEAVGSFCKYVIRLSRGFRYRRSGEAEFESINDFALKRGRRHDLGKVDYTREHKIPCRVVVLHDHQQVEPWILGTNLYGAKRALVVEYYGVRFRIEEGFRDLKDVRSGFKFSSSRMKKPEHLSRLLAVVCFGYLVLQGCGKWGEQQAHQRDLQGNTRKTGREIAAWRVGDWDLKYNPTLTARLVEDNLRLLTEYFEGEDDETPLGDPTTTSAFQSDNQRREVPLDVAA